MVCVCVCLETVPPKKRTFQYLHRRARGRLPSGAVGYGWLWPVCGEGGGEDEKLVRVG